VATPDREKTLSELGQAVNKTGKARTMATRLSECADACGPEAVMNIPSEVNQSSGMNALNYSMALLQFCDA
jgi:hypothetical protein